MSEINPVLTTDEVMEILRTGRKTTYTLIETGQIKAFKVGGKWKIPVVSVEEFIEAQRQRRESEDEYRRQQYGA